MAITDELYEKAQKVMNSADTETADLLEILWQELRTHELETNAENGIALFWKARAEVAEKRLVKIQEILPVVGDVTEVEFNLCEVIEQIIKDNPRDLDNPRELNDAELAIALTIDKEVSIDIRLGNLLQNIPPYKILNTLIYRGHVQAVGESDGLSQVVKVDGKHEVIFPLDRNAENYVPTMITTLSEIIMKDYTS